MLISSQNDCSLNRSVGALAIYHIALEQNIESDLIKQIYLGHASTGFDLTSH